jgi:hypothetical protein
MDTGAGAGTGAGDEVGAGAGAGAGAGVGAGAGAGAGAGGGGGLFGGLLGKKLDASGAGEPVALSFGFGGFLPPSVATSCSGKLPMPARSALRSATAGSAVSAIANASTRGLAEGASILLALLLLFVLMAPLPCPAVDLVTIRNAGVY